MFGLGLQELLIVMVVAIVVVGPKKLPEIAKALGKGLSEFKRATEDIKSSIDSSTGISDIKDTFQDMDLEKDLDVEYYEEDEAGDGLPRTAPKAPKDSEKNSPRGEKKDKDG